MQTEWSEGASLREDSPAFYSTAMVFASGDADWIRAFTQFDYCIGMHAQEFYEINIIESGEGRHHIERRSMAVKQGDAFIIPPYVRHGYRGGEGFHVYHVLIHPRFLEKYTADLQALPYFHEMFNIEPLLRMSVAKRLYLRLDAGQFDRVRVLMAQLVAWQRPHDSATALMCNSAAVMLIAQLCALYAANHSAMPRDETEFGDGAFMESVACVYNKYNERITVEQLAKMACLSRTAYFARFKRVMGMSPAAFLIRRRLDMAKSMLSGTNMSVAEVAERTGFFDASHLARSLRRHENCSTLELRKPFKNRGDH